MCPPGLLAPKPTLLPILSDVSNMKRFLDNAALPCVCSILKGFSKREMPTTNDKISSSNIGGIFACFPESKFYECQ